MNKSKNSVSHIPDSDPVDHNSLETSSLKNRIFLLERERYKLIKSKDVLAENFTRLASLCKYEISKLLDQLHSKDKSNDPLHNGTLGNNEPVFLDPCVPKISFSTLLKYLYVQNNTSSNEGPKLNDDPMTGLVNQKFNGSSSSSVSSSSESDSSSSASSISNVKIKKPMPLKEKTINVKNVSPKENTIIQSTRKREEENHKYPRNDTKNNSSNRKIEPSKDIISSLKRKAEASVHQHRRNESSKRSSSRRGRLISDDERRRLDRKYERLEENFTRNHENLKQQKKLRANDQQNTNSQTIFTKRMSERMQRSEDKGTSEETCRRRESSTKDNQSLVSDVLQALATTNNHESQQNDDRNLDLDDIYQDDLVANTCEKAKDHDDEFASDNLDRTKAFLIEEGQPQPQEKEPFSPREIHKDSENFGENPSLDRVRDDYKKDDSNNLETVANISMSKSHFEPINQSENELEEGEAISEEEEIRDLKSILSPIDIPERKRSTHNDDNKQHSNRYSHRQSLSPPRHHHRFRSPRSPSPSVYRKRIRRCSPHFNRDLPDHLRKRLSTPNKKPGYPMNSRYNNTSNRRYRY